MQACVTIAVGAGCQVARSCIIVAFGRTFRNVKGFRWAVPKRKRSRRGPNRPHGSTAIGMSTISFSISSPMINSPNCTSPVVLSFLFGLASFFRSYVWMCVSAAAVNFSITLSSDSSGDSDGGGTGGQGCRETLMGMEQWGQGRGSCTSHRLQSSDTGK